MNPTRPLRAARAARLAIAGAALASGCRGAIGVGDLTFDRCQVLYVAADGGDDENDGCSGDSPMKTIGAAIAAAKARSIVGGTIRVCGDGKAFAYRGPITLDYPISLRGTYPCDTWERVSGFGYPFFGSANQTALVPDDEATNKATLLVQGSAIDQRITIDGFSIIGPSHATVASAALVLVSSATPHLSDLLVLGGGTIDEAPAGSTGVVVADNWSPSIEHCVMLGGSGHTKGNGGSVGSVGISLEGNAAVHDCSIDGGNGTSDKSIGSVGVFVFSGNLTGDAAFQRNQVVGGRGNAQFVEATVGVFIASTGNIDLLDNTIFNESGFHAPSVAVEVSSAKEVHIERNKIAAGVASSSVLLPAYTRGVLAYEGKVTILNNMIFGGGGTPKLTSVETAGVEGDAAELTIWNNTILMGEYRKLGSAGVDLYGGSADVRNNLILASQNTGQAGIVVPSSLHALHVFENNVFYVPTDMNSALLFEVAGKNSTSINVMADVESALNTAGETAKDNVAIAPACGTPTCACGDVSCLVVAGCTGASACASALFTAWDLDGGRDTLLQMTDGGWRLSPTAPAAVREGGGDLTHADPPVTVDLFGRRRTVPLSVGAHECDAASCD